MKTANKLVRCCTSDDMLMEIARRYCLAQGLGEFDELGDDPLLSPDQSEWFENFNELMIGANDDYEPT